MLLFDLGVYCDFCRSICVQLLGTGGSLNKECEQVFMFVNVIVNTEHPLDFTPTFSRMRVTVYKNALNLK